MKGCIRKTQWLASAGLVALAAATASSANAAPAPMYSWSGFYIGANAGYGWGRDPFTDATFGGKLPPLTDINSKGFLGGFQAGANWQSGSWVGGLEIDLSATGIKGSSPTVVGGFVSGPLMAIETAAEADKFEWLGSARARLGYLVLPNVLFYGTAGPAWTRLVRTQTANVFESEAGTGSEAAVESESDASWRFGAVAGVGAETRLGDSNWLARLEYLHYDFGTSGNSFDGSTDFFTSGRLTADILRAGLSYQFWQDPGSASYASAARPGMLVKAPRAAPWTWSGFYLGGHAGYGWGHDPFTDPNEGVNGNITITGIDSHGFVGGIQAGVNRQMGAWVGGLEFDLSESGIKGSTSATVPLTGGATGTDTLTESDNFELLGSTRARVGYLAWPDVLIYGTGGLAWTRLAQGTAETTVVTSGGTSSASSSVNVNWELGWVAGLGVETRLWNSNWLGRIEYLHYDFGDSGSSFDNSGVTFSSGHLTTDVVRAGLSYKFDWSDPTAGPARVAMPVKAMPVKAMPVMASSWNGIYVGGHAGYGWGRDPMSESISISGTLPGVFGSDPIFPSSINSNGYVAGFQAGVNRQMGSFVTGLEMDLSATGIKGSTTNIDLDHDQAETPGDKLDMLGSARARLGYLALPNVLFYGTGGLGWTRVSQSFLEVTTGAHPGVNGSTFPAWEFGWVAGAGAETMLWNSNWLLRVEYLHYDFGSAGDAAENVVANTILGSGSGSATESLGHLTADVVRTALSFKFN
jgi:opacity protein-like surface antigen